MIIKPTLLQLNYCNQMKSKIGSKGVQKRILQKTASVVVLHSHRNSNFSQSLPINYNDSLLSMRSNYASYQIQSNCLKIMKTEPNQKNANNSRKQCKIKRSNKDKSNASTKKSEPKIKTRRNSDIGSLEYQLKQQTHQSIINRKTKVSLKKASLNQPRLNKIQSRVQDVLTKYKKYTQQLQKQVKNYKFKYHSAIKILKKITKVER